MEGQIGRKDLDSRGNRKLRLAEMARQRRAVLQEGLGNVNVADGTVVFLAGRAG